MIFNPKQLVSPNNPHSSTIYDTYFPITDAFGTDKNVDIADMDAKWLYTYFDNLQILYDYDVRIIFLTNKK